jgi:RimJ/RimL family protein N-acetyltransferase
MESLARLKRDTRLEIAKNCYLRPILETDVTRAYVDGLNNPLVNQYLVASRKQPQTMETVRAYVRHNHESPDQILFGIFIDKAIRGTVRLHHIDRERSSANLGVALFDSRYWGLAWGSKACQAVITFAHKVLGLTCLDAGMVAKNAGSRKLFTELGFQYRPDRDMVDAEGVMHHFWVLPLE